MAALGRLQNRQRTKYTAVAAMNPVILLQEDIPAEEMERVKAEVDGEQTFKQA